MAGRANFELSPAEDEVSFICPNFAGTYEYGTLKLPPMFAEIYGEKLPSRVYIHLPNGAVWVGTYNQSSQRIEGLGNMMLFYQVKPYHLLTFLYSGSSDFLIQIFNTYAVEIDYPFELKPYNHGRHTRQNRRLLLDTSLRTTDFETDRLFSSFRYNAFSGGLLQHDLKICNNHLLKKKYYQIFSEAACSELGLNRAMTWIELGFRKYMWHINLKWEKEYVLCSSEWFFFVKAGGIHEGDICVFQSTSHPQRFEVAIFEKDRNAKINRAGYEEGKGLLKWFKVLDNASVTTGELELPRLFVEEFADSLGEEVKFLLADATEYGGYFCKAQNSIFCFKKLFEKYSVSEYFIIFFEFVGESTFYVSLFNTDGMDIFNNLPHKLLLKEVIRKVKPEDLKFSDAPLEEAGGEIKSLHTTGGNSQVFYFSVVMKASHVDQNGHGVYIARQLLPIYDSWENGTTITLLCAATDWKVAVHRKGKMCRFGRGWDQFIKQNHVALGDQMEFTYVHDYTFQVTISN